MKGEGNNLKKNVNHGVQALLKTIVKSINMFLLIYNAEGYSLKKKNVNHLVQVLLKTIVKSINMFLLIYNAALAAIQLIFYDYLHFAVISS